MADLYRVWDSKLEKYHTQEGYAENINDATLFSKEQAKNLCATFSDCELRPEIDPINTAAFNKQVSTETTAGTPVIVNQPDVRKEWSDTFNAALNGALANADEYTLFTHILDSATAYADQAAIIRNKKFGVGL